jgi:hypothetical protein
MILRLTNTNNSDSTQAISIANSKFYVTYGGKMKATNAEIEGKVTATSGQIGNWTISDGAISNGTTYLKKDGSVKLGENFTVDTDGNVTITGEINADSGSIGNWNIGTL